MISGPAVEQIAAEFDLGTVRACTGPTARGELGEVFRLTSSTGVWAVKRHFSTLDGDPTGAAAFAAAASAHGVRTPMIRRTVGGRILVDTVDGPIQVSEWIELCERDPLLDPAAVGDLVARLHRTEFITAEAEHRWYTEPVGAARWSDLSARLRAADAPFAADLDRLIPELLSMESLHEPGEWLRPCHRDLWADNVRATADDGLCVFDWDNFGPADPSHELCMVLYQFGYRDGARCRTLYDAYLDGGGPGRISRPGQFTFLINNLGHINERACQRWLDATPDDLERPRMAALFDEFVEMPLNVDVIGEILDAIS